MSGNERSQGRELQEARRHGQLHTQEPAAGKSGLPEAIRGPGWAALTLSWSAAPWGGFTYGLAPTGR